MQFRTRVGCVIRLEGTRKVGRTEFTVENVSYCWGLDLPGYFVAEMIQDARKVLRSGSVYIIARASVDMEGEGRSLAGLTHRDVCAVRLAFDKTTVSYDDHGTKLVWTDLKALVAWLNDAYDRGGRWHLKIAAEVAEDFALRDAPEEAAAWEAREAARAARV